MNLAMSLPENLPPEENDTRLLDALASLNQISDAINRLGPGDAGSRAASLELIVQSAIRVVPGSSAVIYTYDEKRAAFHMESRVYAGPHAAPPAAPAGDHPRPAGLGARAIARRARVISYQSPDLDIHPFHAALGVQAVCCFPLIVAEQVVGLLYVYLHEAREFTRQELLMLDNFVNQAAMAIYHTHRLDAMSRDLERMQDELQRLRRASLLISSRLRLKDTLEAILELALDVTGARYGIFRLLDKGGQTLITSAIAGDNLDRPLVEALPLDAPSVMGQAARSRQAILIPDLQASPWSQMYYPLDPGLEMRSELAVPLINASGRLEGVLNLESPLPAAFSEYDSHMLQSLATYAVIAIQEARLLDALQEIAGLLLSQPAGSILARLAEAACDLLNTSSAAIWLLENDELVLQASSGAARRGNRLPLHNSLTGLALLQRQAVVADDVSSDLRFFRPDLARAHRWVGALVSPMLPGDGGAPIGAFAVYSPAPGSERFAESDWDKKVLAFLAQYAVLALQNETRQQALRAAREQRAVAETFAAVGDIASNLLHQLNNKVGTIPVRVQNIQDKSQPALQSDAYLAHNLLEIERCALEAMQAVGDNLSHLRPLRLEPVRIAACVQDAIQAASVPVDIQVRTSGLENLPVVMANAQSLTFVFSNLLGNALAAIQGMGRITFKGSRHGSHVEIAVSDNGPGIPPELHGSIFELNYSGRGARRPGSLGFGLWWVKNLMNRLGGSVSVESDGRHGTTFHLSLPLSAEEMP